MGCIHNLAELTGDTAMGCIHTLAELNGDTAFCRTRPPPLPFSHQRLHIFSAWWKHSP